MEFTFDDARKLCALLTRQQTLIDKKRRWLASMIPKPDGPSRKVKRPKFLREAYLPESYIRSDEVSCEKVRTTIEKSLNSELYDYTNHLVQDGLRLFDFQGKENAGIGPESLDIMHRIISKLSCEALQSVSCIVSDNKSSFDNSRLLMEKMVKSHLLRYLTNLDNKDIVRQLFNIFRNPCSYRSGSVSLVTPVSPELLTAINNAMDGLDGLPTQVFLAMNRKLREKPCTPKFGLVSRASKRGHALEMVRKRCNKILTELEEGNYLPKKLAKAMSVVNLYRKQKLRSVDISQSEFFPFPKETLSMQNNILNAIWSLQKLKHRKLKLLRPILNQHSLTQNMHFKVALRNYLTECLFECDEAGLPDEALRVISFINQISRHQQPVLTEERVEAEVDAVLNLSSHLRALAHCCTDECSCDEEFIRLENDSCNEGNDFKLSETSYLKLTSGQQQMPESCCFSYIPEPCCSNDIPEPCCSNDIPESCSNNRPDTDVTRQCFGSTIGATHNISRPGDPDSNSAEVLKKTCERIEDSGGSGMGPDAEKFGDGNQLKKSRCSEINKICDETSIVAHKLIGQILDTWLLVENNGLDELTGEHLEGGLISHGPQEDNGSLNSVENLERDILIRSVKHILPNLSKSCMDRIKMIMS